MVKQSIRMSVAAGRNWRMLVGGLICGQIFGGLTLVISLALGGVRGLISALLGLASVLLFFSIGQAVEIIALELVGYSGLILAIASYTLRVIGIIGVLWVALSLTDTNISSQWLVAEIVSTTIGWVIGLVWIGAHQRVPVFDSDYQPPSEDHGE